MTVNQLIKILSMYPSDTEVRFAQFDNGIVTHTFEVETVGDYTDQEKPHVLIL